MSASYTVVVGPIFNLLGNVLGKALGERPTLEVWPERLLGGATVFMYLKVHNPMLHKVDVLNINVEPKLFQVWRDSSVGAAVDAEIGGEPESSWKRGKPSSCRYSRSIEGMMESRRQLASRYGGALIATRDAGKCPSGSI